MLTAQRRQLPSALVVFDQKSFPEQERLRDLTHRPGRQAEPGGDDVEPGVTLGQDAEISLFGRPQAQVVNLFKNASPLKVRQGNRPLSF